MLASENILVPTAPTGFWALFSSRRLIAYSRILVCVFLLTWLAWAVSGDGLSGHSGATIGGDFVSFWTASSLALAGREVDAYDEAKLNAAKTFDREVDTWHYPPDFLLFVLPLSLLPYLLALVVWLLSTGSLLLVAIRQVSKEALVIWLGLAFPATFMNAANGQTGFLTAGLLAWGIALLPKRPYLAGMAFGLLTFKPHFFPLVVVALVVARQWKALGGAALSAATGVCLSLLLFGTDVWVTFIEKIPVMTDFLYAGVFPLQKMQSVTAAVLLLGAPALLATIAQATATLLVIGVVAWLWRLDTRLEYKAAGLALGALLASPYSYFHDLTLLGLALLWLVKAARETGWLSWERELLVLAWALPVLGTFVALLTNLLITPALLATLLALIVLRARQEREADRSLAAVLAAPMPA